MSVRSRDDSDDESLMRESLAVNVPSMPIQAIIWMVASCVFFAAAAGLIRYLSTAIDPIEIVFFRNLFGVAIMLPWLMRNGLQALSTRRLPLHALRSSACLVAMTAWFIAISHTNLADAVALSFTTPLFATVAAVLLLGEMIRVHRCVALFLGFLGAMIILRPGFQEISPMDLLVLLSASMMAIAAVMAKTLTRTDSSAAIVFYTMLFLTPASLIPALFVWQTPTFYECIFLFAIGGAATLSHFCVVRAFSLADASAVLLFDFIRLPFIALIGYYAFGEKLDSLTGIGAAIIIGASVYIARRESARPTHMIGQSDAHSPRPLAGVHKSEN